MVQTARLLERLDYAPQETSAGKSMPSGVVADTGVMSSLEKLEIPDFKSRHAPGYDAASRVAARINASAISKQEQDAFLAERAMLLKKKYESSLTRRETNRLAYVRWSLDRIEDAKHGADLDILESGVSEYEDFLDEIRNLSDRIAGLGKGKN
jgi:hypothetical protein